MSWQPIEIAPKDGTPVFLFFGDDCKQYSRKNPSKYMVKAKRRGGEWADSDNGRLLRFIYDFDHEPTHWMPLPKGPE